MGKKDHNWNPTQRAPLFFTLSKAELCMLTFWCRIHRRTERKLSVTQIPLPLRVFWANRVIWQDTHWRWQKLICKHLISTSNRSQAKEMLTQCAAAAENSNVNRLLQSRKLNLCENAINKCIIFINIGTWCCEGAALGLACGEAGNCLQPRTFLEAPTHKALFCFLPCCRLTYASKDCSAETIVQYLTMSSSTCLQRENSSRSLRKMWTQYRLYALSFHLGFSLLSTVVYFSVLIHFDPVHVCSL